MNMVVVQLSLIFAFSLNAPAQASIILGERILNTSLKKTGLSYKAQIAARLRMGLKISDNKTVTIKDLLELRIAQVYKTTHHDIEAHTHELGLFLSSLGLRFGLTPDEIETFKLTLKLESPSLSSFTDALVLPTPAYRYLESINVNKISDLLDLDKVDSLFFAGPYSDLIIRALNANNFKTKLEPLPFAPLSAKTLSGLKLNEIYTFSDLQKMTIKDLQNSDNLGQIAISEILTLMQVRGVAFYDSFIDEAVLEQKKVKLDTPLIRARLSRSAFIALYRAGVRSVEDLITLDKVRPVELKRAQRSNVQKFLKELSLALAYTPEAKQSLAQVLTYFEVKRSAISGPSGALADLAFQDTYTNSTTPVTVVALLNGLTGYKKVNDVQIYRIRRHMQLQGQELYDSVLEQAILMRTELDLDLPFQIYTRLSHENGRAYINANGQFGTFRDLINQGHKQGDIRGIGVASDNLNSFWVRFNEATKILQSGDSCHLFLNR